MRRITGFAAVLVLVGCKGPNAEITGTTLGIAWGDTKSVYFGEPFIVLSNLDADCMDVSWVERNYDEGESPIDGDAQILQFVYEDATPDDGVFVAGRQTVDIDTAARATVLSIADGTMQLDRATSGVLNLDVVDEDYVEGSFEAVTFDDGSVTGSFTAEWCRNLGI